MASFVKSKSCSQAFREEGNVLYRKAFLQEEGRPPVLRVNDAEKALKCYQDARSNAADAREWLSATKNIALTHLNIVKDPRTSANLAVGPVGEKVVLYHLESAFAAFSEANTNGRHIGHETQWLQGIQNKVYETLEVMQNFYLHNFVWQKRIACLEKMASKLDQVRGRNEVAAAGMVSALLLRNAAQELEKQAVLLDESGQWAECLDILAQMNYPLEELRGRLYGRDSSLSSEYGLQGNLTELLDSQQGLQAKAESAQQVAIAQKIQHSLLNDAEELDMDLLWQVMDHYKSATLAAERSSSESSGSSNMESEAIALSAQGEVYFKILKNDEKANELFIASMTLAQAITASTGKQFHSLSWYKTAHDGLQEIRTKRAAYDQAEINAQRAPTLAKIKPQLDAIEAAMAKSESKRKQALFLLKHIYEQYPPKMEAFSPPKADLAFDNNSDMKRALIKAVSHYHSDKPCNKNNGIEWYVLCEEITKLLNKYHDVFKSFE